MSESTQIELREYLERILDEREKALILTADALDKRLNHLNALRDDVIRDRALFVPRELFITIVGRVEALERWQARVVGVGLVLVIVAGTLGGIVVRLFTK